MNENGKTLSEVSTLAEIRCASAPLAIFDLMRQPMRYYLRDLWATIADVDRRG